MSDYSAKELRQGIINSVYEGHADAVQEFLDEGADVDTIDDEGQTLFQVAAQMGDKSVIAVLARAKDLKESSNPSTDTLLKWASRLTNNFNALTDGQSIVQLLKHTLENQKKLEKDIKDLKNELKNKGQYPSIH